LPALSAIGLFFALSGFSASPPLESRLSLDVEQGTPKARQLMLDGDFADPFVLRAGSGYYAFASGARGSHLQLAKSPDLSRWTMAGDPLPKLPAWAAPTEGLTWAPAVLARGTSFVLYFTTRDAESGFQCISRATAARPEGPYIDGSTRAMICQVGGRRGASTAVGGAQAAAAAGALCGSIDPSPFVDADGTAYLLWKSDENASACRTAPRLWSQRLSPDGLELLGAPSALLARDRAWEGDIVEAPSMIKRGNAYYLFYSANWYDSSAYAIGYAVCSSPTSSCRKMTGAAPFLASAGALLGPGGQELFTDAAGALWMAYHAWTAPHAGYQAGGERRLRLAKVAFGADGAPLATLSGTP
jgi:beta-xylosidase